MKRVLMLSALFVLVTAAFSAVMDDVVKGVNAFGDDVHTVLLVKSTDNAATDQVIGQLREAFTKAAAAGAGVRILDRDSLKGQLKELKLKESELVDSERGPELGKILAADAFLYVSVKSYHKGPWGEEVNATLSLVKVETGQELYARTLTDARLSYVGWATYYAIFGILLLLVVIFFFAFRKRRVMGDRVAAGGVKREDALRMAKELGRTLQDQLSHAEKTKQTGWLDANRALDDLAGRLQGMAGGSERDSRKKDVKRYEAVWKETAAVCEGMAKEVRKGKADSARVINRLRDLTSRMM